MCGFYPVEVSIHNPIAQKSDKRRVSNYMPISLLSCISKVLERAVFHNLYTYLQPLLSHKQSGFLLKHSTVTQLLDICQTVAGALDNHKEILFLFFYISKAFDRVWHKGMLHKLQQYGIKGNVLHWIKNYLTDRHQKVVLNGILSSVLKIKSGVPQGSVLGPLLFLVFINYLPLNITSNIR